MEIVVSRPRFAAFAGSWSQPSKTRRLVEEIAARAIDTFGGSAHVFDVGDLGPEFGTLRQLQHGPHSRHLEAFLSADALIVASPVYKGSYTGLFKHFIDLIDPAELAGKPVLLAATGGGQRHALVIEHQLRPIFGFFEAQTLATGVYAASADFLDDGLAPELSQRLDRAVRQFGAHLPRHQAEPLRAVG
jgi:FMN reductase